MLAIIFIGMGLVHLVIHRQVDLADLVPEIFAIQLGDEVQDKAVQRLQAVLRDELGSCST